MRSSTGLARKRERLSRLEELQALRAEISARRVALTSVSAPSSPAALAQIHTADLNEASRWKPYRWHRLYNDHLVALAHDVEESFLIVEAPIRHGKSKLGSVYFPAWWHGVFPDDPVIGTSHNSDLAEDFSREIRDVIDTCGGFFPGHPQLSSSSAAVRRWHFAAPHQGSHVAVGTGNPPIGKGGRLIVIDDPYPGADQAYSQLWRDKVWRWWQINLRGRLKPKGGAIVIIMSRWHEDDLVGRLLAAQEAGEETGTGQEAFRWRVLHLPALAEPSDDEPDPLGRDSGEALWPEWYPADKLTALRAAVGGLAFEAQYQGRPTSPEGEMFRIGDWKYVSALPHEVLAEAGGRWCRRWDLAGTEAKGSGDPDWTAGVLLARGRDGRTFVVDARRIRAEPLGVQRFIRNTFEEDRARWKCRTVRMAIDPGVGKHVFSEYSRLVLPDADLSARRETGAKDVRARPWAAQVGIGNVCLLEGAWNADYVEEHRGFPLAKHDDFVDASALAYLDLAQGTGPTQRSPLATARSRHRR